jgi:hypothetical protein
VFNPPSGYTLAGRTELFYRPYFSQPIGDFHVSSVARAQSVAENIDGQKARHFDALTMTRRERENMFDISGRSC